MTNYSPDDVARLVEEAERARNIDLRWNGPSSLTVKYLDEALAPFRAKAKRYTMPEWEIMWSRASSRDTDQEWFHPNTDGRTKVIYRDTYNALRDLLATDEPEQKGRDDEDEKDAPMTELSLRTQRLLEAVDLMNLDNGVGDTAKMVTVPSYILSKVRAARAAFREVEPKP